MSLIDAQDLTKTFKVRQRSAGTGTGAALKRLLRPGWELPSACAASWCRRGVPAPPAAAAAAGRANHRPGRGGQGQPAPVREARYAPDSTILVELAEPAGGPVSVPGAREVARDDDGPGGLKLRIRFRRDELPVTEVTAYLMRHYPVRDFRIQKPQIEDILRELYEQRVSDP